MTKLFSQDGAEFSECRKFRFALWRIWDVSKPFVMFIGLNPSTANETDSDPTIKSVMRIANHNGFGGVYMMNCFPFVSTDPSKLSVFAESPEQFHNNNWLVEMKLKCSEVVFAWGSFKVVHDLGRDKELLLLFPNAKCLEILKGGQPKHPLYCRSNTTLIPFYTAGKEASNG